ncbi:MAG: cyclic nucleotide-binding domain-containing protein, partial [Vampirovibrionia bacterium]
MCSFDTKHFNKGDLIIKEGERSSEAFVINKGHVEVKKRTLDGEEVVIARLDPGQIFGEMSLFDNTNRSASVYALSNVELSIIKKEDFLEYLNDTPPQINVIIELLLKRL